MHTARPVAECVRQPGEVGEVPEDGQPHLGQRAEQRVVDGRSGVDLEAIDLSTGEREMVLDSVMDRIVPSTASELVDDEPNDALVQRITPDDPDGNGIWLVQRDRLFR